MTPTVLFMSYAPLSHSTATNRSNRNANGLSRASPRPPSNRPTPLKRVRNVISEHQDEDDSNSGHYTNDNMFNNTANYRSSRHVIKSQHSSYPSSSSNRPFHSDLSLRDALSQGLVKPLPNIISRDISKINYNDILKATTTLTTAQQWRSIVRIFETTNADRRLRDQFTSRIYSDLFFAVMKIASRTSSRQAFQVFKGLTKSKEDITCMRPKAFNSLFVALCKSLLIDEAKIVHQNCIANGYYLNRYSYNAFLNACSKTNRVEDAFHSLKAMAESNIHPDVVSCNVLIACCVRSDEIDVALGILHRMPQWGISPDTYSYNSVINGFRKAQMLEEAFDLVASMELAAGLEPIEGRTPPEHLVILEPNYNQKRQVIEDDINDNSDSSSYNSILSDSDDDHEENRNHPPNPNAERIVEAVKPDLVTYNTLISGIAASDAPELERARGIENHLKKMGLTGNEVTYNALMATATRSGQVEEAFVIYEEMKKINVGSFNVELFTTLITVCGQAGQLERAFQVHDRMISEGVNPSVVTFNALLTACRRGNRPDSSDIALDVMKIMRDTPDCVPDVITYSTLIDTLGRDGRFTEMNDLLAEMKDLGLSPNFVTYTSMIGALCKSGDLDAAIQLFHEMEEKKIEPNIYTFSCLVGGARRKKDIQMAIFILKLMKDRGVVPNNVTYALLIQMIVKSGLQSWKDQVLAVIKEDERFLQDGYFDMITDLVNQRDAVEQLDKIYDIIDEATQETRRR